MAGDAQARALARPSPIEQQHAAAHTGDGLSQGYFRVQIKHVRRIDERWDQDRRRTMSPAIAQCRPFNLEGAGAGSGQISPLGAFISGQSGQCGAGHFRVAIGGMSDQRQE